MNIDKPITLDLLDNQTVSPALSSVSDMPIIETKPDATNEGKPPEPKGAEVKPAEEAAAAEPEKGSEQPGESATPATEEHSGEPAKKEARGVQKALDRLTAEREEQRRRAEAAEERERIALETLQRVTGKPAAEAAQETKAADPEPARPSRDKFPDPDAWERALLAYADEKAAWVARREVQAQRAEEQAKAQEEATRGAHQALQEAHRQRMDKAKSKYADFMEVAEASDVEVSIPMVAAILHSEIGGELQYHIGKLAKENPAEFNRLKNLPPPAQILELGKLEARLMAPPAPPETKPNVSAAPRPINPVRPTGDTVRKPVEEMSMEEYVAHRKQEQRATRH